MEVLVLDQSYYTPRRAIYGRAKPYLMQEQRSSTKSGFEKFARFASPKPYKAEAGMIWLAIARLDK